MMGETDKRPDTETPRTVAGRTQIKSYPRRRL